MPWRVSRLIRVNRNQRNTKQVYPLSKWQELIVLLLLWERTKTRVRLCFLLLLRMLKDRDMEIVVRFVNVAKVNGKHVTDIVGGIYVITRRYIIYFRVFWLYLVPKNCQGY